MNPVHNIPSFIICAVNNRIALFRYARFITRDEKAANAIADTALVALWDKRACLHTHAAIRTFLHTATRLACYTWLRRRTLSLIQQKTIGQPTDFNLIVRQLKISRAHSPEIPPSTTYTEKP